MLLTVQIERGAGFAGDILHFMLLVVLLFPLPLIPLPRLSTVSISVARGGFAFFVFATGLCCPLIGFGRPFMDSCIVCRTWHHGGKTTNTHCVILRSERGKKLRLFIVSFSGEGINPR